MKDHRYFTENVVASKLFIQNSRLNARKIPEQAQWSTIAILSIVRGCLCLPVDTCFGKFCEKIKVGSTASRSMVVFNNLQSLNFPKLHR